MVAGVVADSSSCSRRTCRRESGAGAVAEGGAGSGVGAGASATWLQGWWQGWWLTHHLAADRPAGESQESVQKEV